MIRQLVEHLYAALAAGDRDAVAALLAPGFTAEFTPSLPDGVGGRHDGTDAIDRGWWALGRAYSVRAEPRELVAAGEHGLLVLGRYRGRARGPGGAAFEALFSHYWTTDGERLTRLVQVTDAAPWLAARPPAPPLGRPPGVQQAQADAPWRA